MNKFLGLFLKTAYPILVFLLLVSLFLNYSFYEDAKRHRNQFDTLLSAIQMVRAIDGYHLENDEFPQSLEVLVPQYLPEIYPATWGTSGWIYKKEEDGFYFAVGYGTEKSMYPYLSYISSHKSWLYDN